MIARGAHLRREVVGRDLAVRRHEDAVLAGERLLDAAVEEVGDVGVLLRLGHVELALAEARQVRRQRVDDERRERDRDRQLVARLVLGQGRDVRSDRPPPRSKASNASSGQRLGQLARAIGPEVEVDDDVAGAHRRRVADDGGLDELVALVARVGGRDRVRGGRRRAARPRGRSRRTRASSAPSGGRGPWRSSGR